MHEWNEWNTFGYFFIFCFNVEADKLCSIYYLEKALLKHGLSGLYDIWQSFTSLHSWIGLSWKIWIIMAMEVERSSHKGHLLYLCMVQKFGAEQPFHRRIQSQTSSVVPTLQAYNAGFNLSQKSAVAAKYADCSWIQCGRKLLKSVLEPVFCGQVAFMFKVLLWTKSSNSMHLVKNIANTNTATQTDGMTRVRSTRTNTNMGITIGKHWNPSLIVIQTKIPGIHDNLMAMIKTRSYMRYFLTKWDAPYITYKPFSLLCYA